MNRAEKPVPHAAPIVLLAAGTISFLLMLGNSRDVEYIGGVDAAAYAEIAQSLSEGRGFTNDCILYSYFYSRGAYPDVTHPEAHYPPLYPVLVAPFFLLLGKSAFAAKIPGMLIGTLLLPLVQFLLTRRLSGSQAAALVSAFAVMLFPMFAARSRIVDEDLLFTMLVLLSCHLAILGRERKNAYLLMGAVMGLAYLAKGTGILLLPAIFLALFVRDGLGAIRDARLWAGMVIALLVMSPWFVRNNIAFGDPFFSTQNYAAGHIAYENLEEGSFRLYDEGSIPTVWQKLHTAGFRRTAGRSLETMSAYVKWSFFDDLGISWTDVRAKNLLTSYTGIPALVGALILVGGDLRRFAGRKTGGPIRSGPLNRDSYVPLVVLFVLLVMLSILWGPFRRLAMPSTAIVIAVGWSVIWIGIHRVVRTFSGSRRVAIILLIVLTIPPLLRSAGKIRHHELAEHEPAPEKFGLIDAGRWIAVNFPESITMTRLPSLLHYYSGEKAVQIPLADLGDIVRIMKYYNVTHLIPNAEVRPALEQVVSGETAGFEKIYDREVEIYLVQYDRMPEYLQAAAGPTQD